MPARNVALHDRRLSSLLRDSPDEPLAAILRTPAKLTDQPQVERRAADYASIAKNIVLHDLLAWRDARIERAELRYWRTFRAEYGKKARAGLLLHIGNAIEWLTPDVLAAPWR